MGVGAGITFFHQLTDPHHIVTDLGCMEHGPTPSCTWNTLLLDSVDLIGVDIVIQYGNTPNENAEIHSVDGGMEVLEGYIMVLFVDGDAIFEHQNQWLSDVED
jgi:hypothetical protein